MNYESHLKKKKHEGKNVYNYTFVKSIYMIIGNCNLGLLSKMKVHVQCIAVWMDAV